MDSFTLKKIFLFVIAIIAAIIVGFAVWTITTTDEPLPTRLEVPTIVDNQGIARVYANYSPTN